MNSEKRNDRMLLGYDVDGTAFYMTVRLAPNEEVCRQCEGTGVLHYDAGYDGFERRMKCECPHCDGEGKVYSETEDGDE